MVQYLKIWLRRPPPPAVSGSNQPTRSLSKDLRKLIPEAWIADKLDPELLLSILNLQDAADVLIKEREAENHGVKLFFPGKQNSRANINKVKPRKKAEAKQLSVGNQYGRENNLLIEGENLQTMKSLHELQGTVDLIIADPPYNVGKGFRYNDNWDQDPNDAGIGKFVIEDDLGKHTKWLRFMYPRLLVMRKMLAPTGVIAVCIGQQELFRLGQLMDEIFDDNNRLAVINWQTKPSVKGDKTQVSRSTEYVLVYAKSVTRTETRRLSRTEETDTDYTNPDNDPKGRWDDQPLMAATYNASADYAIQSPFTGDMIYPASGWCWSFAKSKLKALLEEYGSAYTERKLNDNKAPALVLKDGSKKALVIAQKSAERRQEQGSLPKLIFSKNGKGRPRMKHYLSEAKGLGIGTYWARDNYDAELLELGDVSWDHEQSGHSAVGTKELKAIVGGDAVNGMVGVKPLKLIQKLIRIWCPPGGTVLDPFAGSGTTGDAILRLNHTNKDDENYKPLNFVLIERGRPEKGDEYARTLTQDRLKRVINGDWVDNKAAENAGVNKGIDGGFSYLQLQDVIDSEMILQMNRDEMAGTVLDSLPRNDGARRLLGEKYQYLIGVNKKDEGIYLIWSGKKDSESTSRVTENVYYEIIDERNTARLSETCHIFAVKNIFQVGRDYIYFNRIPNQILQNYGIVQESLGDDNA